MDSMPSHPGSGETPTTDIDHGAIDAAFDDLFRHPVQAVSILAPASRFEPDIRSRLAEARALRALIQLIDSSHCEDVNTTSLGLRCIGNACLDSPTARDRIVSMNLSWIKKCLNPVSDNASLQLLALKVLYNICKDHEAAQQACRRERVHHDLWRMRVLFREHDGAQDDLNYLAELLLCITEGRTEGDAAVDASVPVDVILDAMILPGDVKFSADAEDFATLVEAALTLLRVTTIQEMILRERLFHRVVDLLYATEQKLSSEHQGTAEAKLLAAAWSGLLWCASDMAALPLMAELYPLDCIELNTMVNALVQFNQGAELHARLPTAACQIIGNVLWNLEPFTYDDFATRPLDGESLRLETVLFQSILEQNDVEYLHAAAGLLMLLSRPSLESRERMGRDPNAHAAVQRLCSHSMSELKQDGVALLKALGRDCEVNRLRFRALASNIATTESSHSDT